MQAVKSLHCNAQLDHFLISPDCPRTILAWSSFHQLLVHCTVLLLKSYISVHSYFLNIMICICQTGSVARRPSAVEEGGRVALSHLPPFLGVEQNYFYGQLVDQWRVIPEIVGVVVWTSDEKKAPPYMERLHKEHCRWFDMPPTTKKGEEEIGCRFLPTVHHSELQKYVSNFMRPSGFRAKVNFVSENNKHWNFMTATKF